MRLRNIGIRMTFDLEDEVDDEELVLAITQALEDQVEGLHVRKFTYRGEVYDLTE